MDPLGAGRKGKGKAKAGEVRKLQTLLAVQCESNTPADWNAELLAMAKEGIRYGFGTVTKEQVQKVDPTGYHTNIMVRSYNVVIMIV